MARDLPSPPSEIQFNENEIRYRLKLQADAHPIKVWLPLRRLIWIVIQESCEAIHKRNIFSKSNFDAVTFVNHRVIDSDTPLAVTVMKVYSF